MSIPANEVQLIVEHIFLLHRREVWIGNADLGATTWKWQLRPGELHFHPKRVGEMGQKAKADDVILRNTNM